MKAINACVYLDVYEVYQGSVEQDDNDELAEQISEACFDGDAKVLAKFLSPNGVRILEEAQ